MPTTWTQIDAWIDTATQEMPEDFTGVNYVQVQKDRKVVVSFQGERSVDALREYVTRDIEPLLTSYRFSVRISDLADYPATRTTMRTFDHVPSAGQNSAAVAQLSWDRERDSFTRQIQSLERQLESTREGHITEKTEWIKERAQFIAEKSELFRLMMSAGKIPLEMAEKVGQFQATGIETLARLGQYSDSVAEKHAEVIAFNDPLRQAQADIMRDRNSGWSKFLELFQRFGAPVVMTKLAEMAGVSADDAEKMANAAKSLKDTGLFEPDSGTETEG